MLLSINEHFLIVIVFHLCAQNWRLRKPPSIAFANGTRSCFTGERLWGKFLSPLLHWLAPPPHPGHASKRNKRCSTLPKSKFGWLHYLVVLAQRILCAQLHVRLSRSVCLSGFCALRRRCPFYRWRNLLHLFWRRILRSLMWPILTCHRRCFTCWKTSGKLLLLVWLWSLENIVTMIEM